jgi:hypothetical protein
MIMTFLTSITDKDGKDITDVKIIAKSYLKQRFWLDLIACFPFRLFKGNIKTMSPEA